MVDFGELNTATTFSFHKQIPLDETVICLLTTNPPERRSIENSVLERCWLFIYVYTGAEISRLWRVLNAIMFNQFICVHRYAMGGVKSKSLRI